jgi:hypothetical protein
MARQHRHAVQPAAPPAAATLPAEEAPQEPGPTPLKWRLALVVWALGFAGLALYELVRFAVRAIRAAVT